MQQRALESETNLTTGHHRLDRRSLVAGGTAVLAGMAAGVSLARAGTAQDMSATPTAAFLDGSVVIAELVSAANTFLDTLSEDERDAVLFDWSDTEQKQRWSNFPEGLFERDGLMWGNISTEAQEAWLALMEATLSDEGYTRIRAQWAADDALAQNEGGGGGPGGGMGMQYGQQYYWIAIIGTPSETDPWQWQWGGHHVTVNATVGGGAIALTPSFIGVQPATYTTDDGVEVRPLGDIDDAAFALINSLDTDQQAIAILGDEYIDLVLGPGEDGRTLQPEGLLASELTAEQKDQLLTLVSFYTGLLDERLAAARLEEVSSVLDQTYLVWYGPTTQGSAAYFRLAGPTIVIEYSPQGMGGNAADHIHGIYRDPSNDYGAKYTA